MNRNHAVILSVVVATAFVIVGAWYWFMTNPGAVPLKPAPAQDESVRDVAQTNEDTAAALAGTWQSTDDARFVRSFDASGAVTDTYEGEEGATSIGTWKFVVDPSEEQAELPAVKDATVIKIQFPEEVLYFAITDLSATDLSMTYLSRGNTLTFKRI